MNAPTPAADRPLAVFAYDFDGTLAPGNMQDHAFIPEELGMDRAAFWAEVRALAMAQRGDEILAYMHQMLARAREKKLELTLEAWRRRGATLKLFDGVEDWFDRQNARADALGLDLRHFIISSGNRELIEGTAIARHFERIYASAFMFDAAGDAIGPALAVNYTSKTQFLFRINKWTLDEWDSTSINKPLRKEERPAPFDRIVYFGDGFSDVPVMRVMSDQGGYPVGVYNPTDEKSKAAVRDLQLGGRARLAAPADYREGSALDEIARGLLEEMAGRLAITSNALWPED
jgi:phosphoserine phosphatase